MSPCTVTAGTYYIGLWVGTSGQMQITVNTVPHKCVTPMNSTFSEILTLLYGDWFHYTYGKSPSFTKTLLTSNEDLPASQYVVFLAQQVSGSASTYVQLDAQPTESYYHLYSSSNGAKSLPLNPCQTKSTSTLHFAVRGYSDNSVVALSLITST